jgi:arsenite methyltransferase
VEKWKMPIQQSVNFGIDAPGLVKFFIGAGVAGFAATALVYWQFSKVPGWWSAIVILLGIASLYLLFMGSLMLFWSKVAKIKGRDKILNSVTWRGDEVVLDVGCGRGLMLVGAAKRLSTGKAIGIDIWQSGDQSANSPDATWQNAKFSGVADRVEIATGDVRSLPYPDCSFDVLVSHWVVHNLSLKADRDRALVEMARVLRPGGRLILADIENREEYESKVKALGFLDYHIAVNPLADWFLRIVSFGSFGPVTQYATKPQ